MIPRKMPDAIAIPEPRRQVPGLRDGAHRPRRIGTQEARDHPIQATDPVAGGGMSPTHAGLASPGVGPKSSRNSEAGSTIGISAKAASPEAAGVNAQNGPPARNY